MINLHTHTERSNFVNLDCIIKPKDLIEYAKELEHKGVAITNHEDVSGHLEAIRLGKELGFKVILGNEIYLCKEDCRETHIFPHFILLAKNARGNRALRELSTIANCENSFTWVSQRKPTYYSDLVRVLSEYKGDVIGSTACAGGALGKMILQGYDPTNWLLKMRDIFGEGNFFMEIQPSVQDEQEIINKKIVELSNKLGIDFIITTDAHYLKKEDEEIHKAFLQSQEADRETGLFYKTTYMMSEEEIHQWLDDSIGYDNVERAFRTSERIGDMIEEYELEKPLNIPYIPDDLTEPNTFEVEKYVDNIPLLKEFAESKWDADRHLVREIIKGIKKEPEVFETERAYEEIQYELNSIKILSEKQNTPWSAYLIMTQGVVDEMWKHSLVGCGRGSGGGFVLLYLLGIIQVCSLKENVRMYPWRFLQLTRIELVH